MLRIASTQHDISPPQERRPGFYISTFIGPAIAIAITILFSSLIPWSIGERISYATTMTLTLTVFLLIVSEHLPKTASTPLLSLIFQFLLYGALVFLVFVIMSTKVAQSKDAVSTEKEKKVSVEHRHSLVAALRYDFVCLGGSTSVSSQWQTRGSHSWQDYVAGSSVCDVQLRVFVVIIPGGVVCLMEDYFISIRTGQGTRCVFD